MKNPEDPYTPNGHLSEQQLLRYEADQLNAAEMQQVERHLLDCPLCSDALEGLAGMEPQQAQAAVAQLKERLATRLQEPENRPVPLYWRWAAAAAVLLLAVTAVLLLQDTATSVDQHLSRQEAPEAPAPAPQPAVEMPQPVDSPRAAEIHTPSQPPVQQPPEDEMMIEEIQELAPQADLAYAEEEAKIPPPVERREMEVMEVAEVEEELIPTVTDTLSGRAAGVAVTKRKKSSRPALPNRDSLPTATEAVAEQSRPERTALAPQQQAQPSQIRIRGTSSLAPRAFKGKVVDASTSDPLPGVAVRIKGTNIGTITDINGDYSLQLPPSDATLSLSFVGYAEKQLVVAAGTSQLVAGLEEDVQALSEVVVTGYGTTHPADIPPPTAPRPTEGMRSFRKWVKENLHYPEAARQAGVEGTVTVSFFVAPDSSLQHIQVVKPLGLGLDEEAIRLVKEGPAWQPATANGKAIGQQASVKITFKLPKGK